MGYDDPESAQYKAQYAVDMGLGGAFVWSVDTDDFRNWCGQGENPIMNTIVNVGTLNFETLP